MKFIKEWLREACLALLQYLILSSTVALCYSLSLIIPN